MAEQMTNYQCPACTGPLHFNGSSGRLECEYCGNSYSAEEIEAFYAEKEKEAAEAFAQEEQTQREEHQEDVGKTRQDTDAEDAYGETAWDTSGVNDDWGEEGEEMRAFHCPSCGAELICEASTAAGSCPYCGNPTIIPGQFAGTLKPDYIIPFRMGKKDAENALKKLYRGKFLLPKNFSDSSHSKEIKGGYVPFWLFYAKAWGHVSYAATRSETHREGEYRVTNTSHFQVQREGSASFERIPADASRQMPDDYMDSIEPFDYGEMREFSTAYLPGYLANKYDVSAEECASRADLRCANSLEGMLRRDVIGYQTVAETGRDIRLQRGVVKYAMLPVWVLNTRWKDQNYLFMMNGQTGKAAGDLPVSKAKYAVLRLCLIGGLTLLFGLVGVGGALASLIV